ncbi:DUF2238 domain-containing protein [Gordoniibacillus kamchatkensis]|uniref:DUF2238 domain-containing protein n=1 Tax=Gordoniibacillus kamchatkensis TaxID=1590651 RepID=UPI000AC294C5|nr:DUF2238 domain-containing protein [Paenibacillus sp. VKM B-2647]
MYISHYGASRSVWLSPDIRFGRNRLLHMLILGYAAFWAWMAVAPYNRFDWLLENLLIFVAVAVLTVTYPFFRFNNLAYALIAVFLALHTYGASFSYNTTPIDMLMHRYFELQRDMYDRVVHASYGLLLAYPLFQFMRRVVGLRGFWSYALTVTTILATGAFYELIEMWVANIVAPEIGVLFLGTQGDVWDSQHDMEVALYGAAVAMVITALARAVRRLD